MRKLGLNQLREEFLTFFENKGHICRESFPLIPQNDAGLLLINSGMAPLKPYFSGEAVPPGKRMATCQKCIRTPDIDRVGQTSRHGTFFEMLGNFSFGDYFKRESAFWAWEFCEKILEMDTDLLYVSVYLDDDEAYDIWTKEVGVAENHMVRLGKADNFWEIGAGPCGPCSEIYYDRGAENGCGSEDCAPGCDCDRFVEFWNLVFTQYNNDGKGNYSPLKQKNIDTGMGLERLACISQGVGSLFEVDTVKRILEHAGKISGTAYGKDLKNDISLRIITDHIRSTVMLIGDGVFPGNEGRGYVLRRLLRRGARHGRLLGIKEPFLHELCETVIKESGQAYPELVNGQGRIRETILLEEERFSKTIDSGLKLLNNSIGEKGSIFGGDTAFKLYDTYGFPVDLTREILEEAGVSLDMDGFNKLMEEQRTRAREARKALGDKGWAASELEIGKYNATEFIGYEELSSSSVILDIIAEKQSVESIEESSGAVIILDKTPFYAESGGQVADHGIITTDSGIFHVINVQKTPDNVYAHIGTVESGILCKGGKGKAEVDTKRRKAVSRAHTAVHLLHGALREVLGSHVTQAGSLVEPDRARLDFTHPKALSNEEIQRINFLVNEKVLEDLMVSSAETSLEQAKKEGAIALFNEKYGEKVRMVRAGDFSIELCGGTHLKNTAGIGSFFFKTESSVAAGIRRIEARVGMTNIEAVNSLSHIVSDLGGLLNTGEAGLTDHVKQLINDLKASQKAIERFKTAESAAQGEKLLAASENIGGFDFVFAKVQETDTEGLRAMGERIREIKANSAAFLISERDGKLTFAAYCGDEAVKNGAKAGDMIKLAAKLCGGSGGGKPQSAMGGGKDSSKINEAVSGIREYLKAL